MYKVKPFLLAFGFCFLIAACSHPQKKSLIEELQLWERKEIKFPSKMQCFSLTQGSENLTFYGKYRILTFWDSVGCISCKLQLAEWNKLMKLMGKDSVQFIYCFSQIPQEVVMKELKVARFYSPVCVDLGGALNKMNDFPTDASFQTFLLDASNRVLVVGNPVRNPKVKELYERIIRGDTEYKTEQELTQAVFAKDVVSLGTFDGREEQKATIALTNVGDVALKISDVIPECDCTRISFPKEEVLPGEKAVLDIKYKAERSGEFMEKVSLYGNLKGDVVEFVIKGKAE